MAQSLRRPTALFSQRRHDWNYFASVPVFRLCDARAWFRARRFYVSAHHDRRAQRNQRRYRQKERGVFARVYAAAWSDCAAWVDGDAAGIQPEASSDVVPALIRRLFPSWFLGFSAAA